MNTKKVKKFILHSSGNPSIYIKEGNKKFHCKLEEAIEVMNLRTESRLEESRKRLIDRIKSFCCLCEHKMILNSKEVQIILIIRHLYLLQKMLI